MHCGLCTDGVLELTYLPSRAGVLAGWVYLDAGTSTQASDRNIILVAALAS